MLHRHGHFGRDDAGAENLCACDGSRAENQSENCTNVSEEAGLHSFQRIVACHVGRSRDISNFLDGRMLRDSSMAVRMTRKVRLSRA